MVWQPEIDELRYRKQLAEKMGGEERVARQHSEGKLTVRERINLLADPDSFQEIGKLTGSAEYYENGKLAAFTPKGSVIGTCRIDRGNHLPPQQPISRVVAAFEPFGPDDTLVHVRLV